jgi:hypothetical protein
MILDRTTGEIIDPIGLTDEELVGMIYDLTAEQKYINNALNQVQIALSVRMEEREASLIDTPEYSAKLVPGTTRYEYDTQLLQMLRAYVSEEKYDAVITFVPKVDKRKLNDLTKLGGEVKRLITEATKAIVGAPKVEVVKKQPDTREGEPANGNSEV